MGSYAELHLHSNYSFQGGASSIEELVGRATELGYTALALTDHDNLCGAVEFARACKGVGIQPIIGAEVTLSGGNHLTLLAETRRGYANLCKLLSYAHVLGDRRAPSLEPSLFERHAEGLIALSGCRDGEVPSLLAAGKLKDAKDVARRYLTWFGPHNFYLELQCNLAQGDTQRVRRLVELAEKLGIGVVATNNVHYHVRERHRLQDCLVAIKHNTSLEESHRERRPNSEFYLKSPAEMSALFRDRPEAVANTQRIADRCAPSTGSGQGFDLTRDLGYRFPDHPVPPGHTPEGYLEELCHEAARRRYGSIAPRVRERLEEEFRLIRKHGLAGFLLLYHEIIGLAREVQVDLGLADPETPIDEDPPGRGRGSSVSMLVGQLIGLSHIDPLEYGLSLERFLPEDTLVNVPDIDLDFPRNIREELILRVHERYGWERAALTGMIATYQVKWAVRDLGKALGLPPDQVDRLAKRVDPVGPGELGLEMARLLDFQGRLRDPGWRDLVELARELDGFPRTLAQHPGGMIISSSPLTEMVPVQPSAIEGRYICQWDKDAIDDAGFVKIDFLALGALSQMQEALRLIEQRTGRRIDLSRIDFEDPAVYEMLHRADTIGVFQVESAAQIQTITRIKPRNLTDMAHEVGAVRPGVGVHDGVRKYIRRRSGEEVWNYDHPLERRALERTHGVILFQDQVNQVAIDVAGLSPSEADGLRRAFQKRKSDALLRHYWERFRDGAARKGVDGETAKTIFQKFNGQYMFPESHAFAFGATAYQAAWLKRYYPLEFYAGLFNQQPMGFYNVETLKEDAKRHGVTILHPDVNLSAPGTAIEGDALRLGLSQVRDMGEAAVKAVVEARDRGGPFRSLGEFMERAGLLREAVESLADAGALDGLCPDRRSARWEIGLRYRPVNSQLSLGLPVEQDRAQLGSLTEEEQVVGEYRTLSLSPDRHYMELLRPHLPRDAVTSADLPHLEDGVEVKVAGLVIRRQRPLAKAVFITLEDERGHSPLVVWPKVYERYRSELSEPCVLVTGVVSRREGTLNVVVTSVGPIRGLQYTPVAKNWG